MGYSAFDSSSIIKDTSATVRPQNNIRITSITIDNASDASASGLDYNINKTFSEITFTKTTSQVRYKLEITNFGNVEKGLASISGLPNNLTYEIDNTSYSLGEKICDDNNNSQCTLGAKKTIYVTIKYKSGSGTNTSTDIVANLDFNFSDIHKVYYAGTEINYVIDGGNKTINLGNNAPSAVNISGTYTSQNYTSPNLTLNGVTSDIYVTPAITTATLSNKILSLVTSVTPDANGIYNIGSTSSCTNTLRYDGTTDNNLRYVGADPCNYVTFNGETWRIIGVFNNVGTEPLVKIVNATSAYSTSVKYNNNNKNGTKVWGKNTLYTSMSSNSAATNSMTQSVQWNVGGPNNSTTASAFYTAEIATKSDSLPIGLINVSDYGFATDNPSACDSVSIGSWNAANCSTNHDWLYFSNDGNTFTITTSQSSNYVYRITTGRIAYTTTVNTSSAARAVVYLKANVLCNSGDGSSTNPYTLS